MVSGDFNQDGMLDLASSDKNQDRVNVLFGDGTGSFSAPLTLAAGMAPRAIATGDWNGDKLLELAVANQAGATVSVLFGDGRGNFVRHDHPGPEICEMAAGDLNNDGLSDLIGTANGQLKVMFSRRH